MANHILYVEDDPFLQDWVAYELSAEGYQVTLAADGESGLQHALNTMYPDLIILDIGLPEMDGFQLCQALQQESKTADIPVIFLSARHTIDDKLQGFELGAIDYLQKPFAIAELKARVQVGLRRHEMGRKQERKTADAEMSEASTLQRNLMQRSVPTVPGIDLAANCRPARHVAGDWFDFQAVDDGDTLYLVEADVSGKGVPAALLMSETRLSLQHACQSGETPAAVLSTTNRQLYDDLTTAGKFITTFVARYSPIERQIQYACAGHPAIYLSQQAERAQLIQPDDPPLGISNDYTFSDCTVGYEPGDILLVCTDGIVEARGSTGEMYGYDRFLDAVTRHRTLTASELIAALLDEVDDFSAGVSQSDDQTVAVLKSVR